MHGGMMPQNGGKGEEKERGASGVRWQAQRDTAFHQGDKRSAAPPGGESPFTADAASQRSLSSAKQKGVALRLPPHQMKRT